MTLAKELGGWQFLVRRSWSDDVKELARKAASPKTGYATVVPYASDLHTAAIVHPAEVRKLAALAPVVDRVAATKAVDLTGAVAPAYHQLLDVGNVLECVGCPLAAGTHDIFRDWLARMTLEREDPDAYHLWSAGFAALALDERPTYRRLAARVGDATLALTPGQTFGLNMQALLGHLAAAVENQAPLAAVTPAWEELLANYSLLYDARAMRLGTLLWAARVVHHRIAGTPLGEVAQRLHDDIYRVAGVP